MRTGTRAHRQGRFWTPRATSPRPAAGGPQSPGESPEVPLLKLLPDTGSQSNFPGPWTLTSAFVGPFLYLKKSVKN